MDANYFMTLPLGSISVVLSPLQSKRARRALLTDLLCLSLKAAVSGGCYFPPFTNAESEQWLTPVPCQEKDEEKAYSTSQKGNSFWCFSSMNFDVSGGLGLPPFSSQVSLSSQAGGLQGAADLNSPEVFKQNIQVALAYVARVQALASSALAGM